MALGSNGWERRKASSDLFIFLGSFIKIIRLIHRMALKNLLLSSILIDGLNGKA